jgi:hypothetical protein
VTLRSREVQVRWSPQLDFFEARLDTMRRLDSQFGLAGFRVTSDSMEALVRNVGELSLGPDHLQLRSLSPAYDPERFEGCIRSALEPFSPADCRVVFRYQLLNEMDLDYDTARRSAIAAWLTPLLGARIDDAAVLVDAVDDATGIGFQVEYGIVKRAEVEARLSRWVGRTRTDAGSAISGMAPDLHDLPAVAVFADFTWMYALAHDGCSSDELLRHGTRTMERSVEIASALEESALAFANTAR